MPFMQRRPRLTRSPGEFHGKPSRLVLGRAFEGSRCTILEGGESAASGDELPRLCRAGGTHVEGVRRGEQCRIRRSDPVISTCPVHCFTRNVGQSPPTRAFGPLLCCFARLLVSHRQSSGVGSVVKAVARSGCT